MRLTVVYHRAFWESQGAVWEREGAFSRFVEALAARVESLELLVPRAIAPSEEGHRLTASNVRFQWLPHWRDLIEFYRLLPGLLPRLWSDASRWDVLVVRLPTPLGFWAWLVARLRHIPTVLIVVGDLTEVAETVPGNSWKRRLYRIWARVEDLLMRSMVRRTLTFANGEALWKKYGQGQSHVLRTTNSTISSHEISTSPPRMLSRPARLLCVSRIDPRKGIRYLPDVLAAILRNGHSAELTIVGGDVGKLGRQERVQAMERAREMGVENAIHYLGAQSIERVHELEREHDVLLVPSLPGEGVPRVIIEAFAAGLPVVATTVAGIPGVVEHERRGLLVPPADPVAMATSVERLLQNNELRTRVIEGGLEFARSNTIEAQTRTIVETIEAHLSGGVKRFGVRRASPLSGDRCSSWGVSESGDARRTPKRSAPATDTPLTFNIPLAGLNVSGGVKSLLYLANALARRGNRVRIIVPDYAAESPISLGKGVELRILSSGPGPASIRKVAYFARLGIEAARDCDLCLANYFLTAYPALTSNLIGGNRASLAYNIRGYEPISHGFLAEAGGVGRELRSSLASLSYRLPLQKICTTDWLKQMVGDDRAIVIGHGIDLEVFHPQGRTARAPGETVTVGVIGRSGDVKGYGDFLQALERIPQSVSFKVVIAGQDNVQMPSGRPFERMHTPTEREMADFYRACDVFVFPSRAEGFGLPPLEAMACSAAVVLTDCGGVHAYAKPDENCLMVPVQDAESMAAAIEKVVGDIAMRERLVAQGHATASQFSRAVVEERFCELLESLARGR